MCSASECQPEWQEWGINISFYCIMVHHENGDAWHKLLEKFEKECSVVKTSTRAGRLFILATFLLRLHGKDLRKETIEMKILTRREMGTRSLLS